MKVHLQLTGKPQRVREHARQLADLGADGLFTFEGQHDVFLPLAFAAEHTSLDLMTNIAVAGPRSPLHLAHLANDLQLYSQGRFRLGVGSQIKPHIEKRYGSTWERPAARMAETVQAIKAIYAAWAGEAKLDFQGEFFTHTLMTPNFNPGPNPYGRPPILMGALGPIMTTTAAEVADGLLVMPFNSTRHFAERTLPAVAEGLLRAGRQPTDLQVIGQVMVAVGHTEEELRAAIDGVASLIAFYASTPAYRPVLEVEDWLELQPELNGLSKRGEFVAMRNLISDEMVRRIGVVGTPAECAAEIARRFGHNVTEVCCYFPGYAPSPEVVSELVLALQGLDRE